MRPVVFASFVLALGTASMSSYACTSRDEYNQNINQLQANYNGAVGAANKQYADKNIPNVVFVDLSARSSAHRYNNTVFYYAELTKKRETGKLGPDCDYCVSGLYEGEPARLRQLLEDCLPMVVSVLDTRTSGLRRNG